VPRDDGDHRIGLPQALLEDLLYEVVFWSISQRSTQASTPASWRSRVVKPSTKRFLSLLEWLMKTLGLIQYLPDDPPLLRILLRARPLTYPTI
jgi:hypothetical protein